ncbi:MAG: glycine reductase [Tissierellia bacterium]|nr:glycine reductase [Tissierellia bacterium]
MSDNVKKMVGKVFNDVANAIETGQFGEKVRIGITVLGSELGVDNIIKGAEMAQEKDPSIEVVLIGPKNDSKLTQYNVDTEDEQHKKMEELLDSKEIDGCVTMHYNFPIGVSTVGRIITPGRGREMILATTTGTSAPHRVEAMIKNGIYGNIVAKALGIKKPTLGIANLDGARQVDRAFAELKANGYDVEFSESQRVDGGVVMRGNDLLLGTPDIMVNDTLTGNLLMKIFSSYQTGGDYEAVGYGYGPGIGEDYERLIMILSRASGSPVAANAIIYAAELVKGKVFEVAKKEFTAANKAGLKDIIAKLTQDKAKGQDEEEVKSPPKEIVTESIGGIDVMELEDAVKALWKVGIYAESGMGCTGPIVMISEANLTKAKEELAKAGFAAEDTPC